MWSLLRAGSRVAVLLLLAAAAFGADKARFPFMAWDYADDRQTLEAMRDCGITVVAFVRPNMLSACQDLGLKAIVFDESVAGADWSKPFDGDRAARNAEALIRKLGDNPAVYGYHIKDEPPERDFAELAKAVAAIKKAAPGKWPYINLFPGTGDSYDGYLEKFVSICSPTALSYDRYVLEGDHDFNPVFWSNLEQVRAAAVRHRLPFWNIVLTSPHWRYRDITPADVRLQVWGSLAYGVSGISFYKFLSKELPILDSPDLGNFRDGPLDQFGEKTQTWYWLRNTIRQIQEIAPVYLGLRSDDVYHIGEVPRRNHGPGSTSLVKDVAGGDYVVGDFTGPHGARYVLIVNKSLTRSAHCVPEFTATPKAVKYVSARTGEVQDYPAKYFWLAPGQGVLLQLE